MPNFFGSRQCCCGCVSDLCTTAEQSAFYARSGIYRIADSTFNSEMDALLNTDFDEAVSITKRRMAYAKKTQGLYYGTAAARYNHVLTFQTYPGVFFQLPTLVSDYPDKVHPCGGPASVMTVKSASIAHSTDSQFRSLCVQRLPLDLISYNQETKYAYYNAKFKNVDSGADRWFWVKLFFCPELVCVDTWVPLSGGVPGHYVTTKQCRLKYGSLTWWVSKSESTSEPPEDPTVGGSDYDPIKHICNANNLSVTNVFTAAVVHLPEPDEEPDNPDNYIDWLRYQQKEQTRDVTLYSLTAQYSQLFQGVSGDNNQNAFSQGSGMPPVSLGTGYGWLDISDEISGEYLALFDDPEKYARNYPPQLWTTPGVAKVHFDGEAHGSAKAYTHLDDRQDSSKPWELIGMGYPYATVFSQTLYPYGFGRRHLDFDDLSDWPENGLADQYTVFAKGASLCDCQGDNLQFPQSLPPGYYEVTGHENANCDVSYVCAQSPGIYVHVHLNRDNTTGGACHCFTIPSTGTNSYGIGGSGGSPIYDPDTDSFYTDTNTWLPSLSDYGGGPKAAFSIKDVTGQPYILCSCYLPTGNHQCYVPQVRYVLLGRYELDGSFNSAVGGETSFVKVYEAPDSDVVSNTLTTSPPAAPEYMETRYVVEGIELPDTITITILSSSVFGVGFDTNPAIFAPQWLWT